MVLPPHKYSQAGTFTLLGKGMHSHVYTWPSIYGEGAGTDDLSGPFQVYDLVHCFPKWGMDTGDTCWWLRTTPPPHSTK